MVTVPNTESMSQANVPINLANARGAHLPQPDGPNQDRVPSNK
jgi:hypothetical protein